MTEAVQTQAATILLVDGDPELAEAMAACLARDNCRVLRASAVDEAVGLLQKRQVHMVMSDARLPGAGLDLLRYVRTNHPDVPVILTADYGSVASAVAAIREGAFDYLAKPVIDDDLRLVVTRALNQQRMLAEGRTEAASSGGAGGSIIGSDYRMMKVFELIDAVADSRATVLITGESGTGKSLVARAIHRRSGRREKPFVEVACGALPETLLESELFGHVRGAFTDAAGDRVGKFAAAEGGTIFLDEISTASAALQAKLLRVLQERRFEPVGSNETRSADVRAIVATNGDLSAEVAAGRFRRDLYYRVNVVNISLPPLRDRLGDIGALARQFLGRYRRENAKAVTAFTDEALQALRRYDWPGNVRELENCIERAVVLCRTGRIAVEDLPDDVGARADEPARRDEVASAATTLAEGVAAAERRIIRAALAACGDNRKAAAEALGINRTTLYKKMKKRGLM